jgi:SNF family Na+-dependent transporter
MSISIVSLVGGMTTLIVTKLRVRRNHQQLMYFIIRFVLLGIVFTSNQHPSSNYHYIRFFVTGCIVQNTLDKKLKFQNPAIQMAEKTVMLMFTVFYTIYWQNNQLT